jgi:hypothetical protein
MARLLRDLDYLRAIQADNLAQIIESNSQIQKDVEQAAQAEMIGYLVQRYKTDTVFSDTKVFSASATYSAKQLVEFTASAFSASIIYTTGQYVLQSGNIYKSIAGSVAHAFNVAEWTLICLDKTLYYVTLPQNEYLSTTTYTTGDQVWFENKVYTATVNIKGIDPTYSGYWGTGTTYSITATYPDDATKFSLGDNRNALIVQYLLDITLYHLHSRINPRNVPDLRKERYNGNDPMDRGGAIGYLKSVASGSVNCDLPEIDPAQGNSIRWGNANGSTTRSSNMYW